jgi:hypothetical protein
MRYAAENITSRDDDVSLMIGVDTCVFHGFVNCGAVGAITGIGCVLPKEVLHHVRALRRPPPRAMPDGPRQARWSWNRRSPCSPPSTKARTSCSTSST